MKSPPSRASDTVLFQSGRLLVPSLSFASHVALRPLPFPCSFDPRCKYEKEHLLSRQWLLSMANISKELFCLKQTHGGEFTIPTSFRSPDRPYLVDGGFSSRRSA